MCTRRERICGDDRIVARVEMQRSCFPSVLRCYPLSPDADFAINQRVCIDGPREGDVLCFLVFVIVLAVALPSPLSASPIRGVSPRDEKYFVGPVIACRDGFATFSKDRLNDGFCDCADGTDEPGTSACPESNFYCINVGDAPRFLFSSRVNDHICDCCDGSDEYESGIECPNTCRKYQNASTVVVYPESNGLNNLTIESKNILIDLENLIKNIRGLRAVVAMQLMVCAALMIAFLLHQYNKHNRIRRKRYLLSK